MRYQFGKSDWQTKKQAQSRCFLLANGLGGYCSQSITGSNARGDQGLLIAAKTAPSERFMMLQRLDEVLYVDGIYYDLSSQTYVTESKNQNGEKYLSRFTWDAIPEWEYFAAGVTVKKRLCLGYGTNSIAVVYEIICAPGQKAKLSVTPVYGFHAKNDHPFKACTLSCHIEEACRMPKDDCKEQDFQIESDTLCLYGKTNAVSIKKFEHAEWVNDYYYEQDAVDGREGYGGGIKIHCIESETVSATDCEEREGILTLQYSLDKADLDKSAQEYCEEECIRQEAIMQKSGFSSDAAKQLAVSASMFLTKRESTGGMSIMAGFPFFGDWGRDTMIAFYGCTLAIGEKEAAKSILRTFMRYCRRGIMPNLFPEGNTEPMYNTVDASLLFINAAWEYLEKYPDEEFAREVWPVAEAVISWYAHGTDYKIHMDEDGLLFAGSGLWQLTWMDVRFDDILPTPRHGKPVEINAYWYNAIKIAEQLLYLFDGSEDLSVLSLKDTPRLTPDWDRVDATKRAAWLQVLAQKIKKSFLERFTKEDLTLYDVIPTEAESKGKTQVRCNEVFALSLPFSMVDEKQAGIILGQIKKALYTPLGLRSLSVLDPEFHATYKGSQFERDMAYHQGTVWVYPLGDYYRACLRYAKDKKKEIRRIKDSLGAIEAAMMEGCIAQLPEIYDGENPAFSKGCFAQAWSVAQLLRVYDEIERELG